MAIVWIKIRSETSNRHFCMKSRIWDVLGDNA
jgi:hypothetical protein